MHVVNCDIIIAWCYEHEGTPFSYSPNPHTSYLDLRLLKKLLRTLGVRSLFVLVCALLPCMCAASNAPEPTKFVLHIGVNGIGTVTVQLLFEAGASVVFGTSET